MTGQKIKRYEHFEECVENSEPVVSGGGGDSQCTLRAKANKWVRLTRIKTESDERYEQRLREENESIAKYRSHLLVCKQYDPSTARMTAVVSSTPMIGYGWMPVIGTPPMSIMIAKAIAIWLNSTLGRVAMRAVGARKIAYPQFNPIAFNSVPYPDVDDKDVLRVLGSCFDDTRQHKVPRFREGRVEIRERWDDAVSEALGIDRNLIEQCAEKLAQDPFVSKDRFYG